jgi:hypothetical protein
MRSTAILASDSHAFGGAFSLNFPPGLPYDTFTPDAMPSSFERF